jgi:hypothetical protein
VRWIEDNRIDGQLFESFDGGGSNGLILECQRSDELVQFCRDWLDGTGIRCWAEDQAGKHHALRIVNGEIRFRASGEAGDGAENYDEEMSEERDPEDLECPFCKEIILPGALEWCSHYLCSQCDSQLICDDAILLPLQEVSERVDSLVAELDADMPEQLDAILKHSADKPLASAVMGGERPLEALLRLDGDVTASGPFVTEGMLSDSNLYFFTPIGHRQWIKSQKPRIDALEAIVARLVK